LNFHADSAVLNRKVRYEKRTFPLKTSCISFVNLTKTSRNTDLSPNFRNSNTLAIDIATKFYGYSIMKNITLLTYF